jgi:hypothetical protein
VRRSDRKQPGQKWDFQRTPGRDGAPDAWLVKNKNQGKGTVFYVPVERVRDWTYPALYQFVRSQHPELELPKVSWTQLHVNRVYQGLYLRVELPFDLRKRDGGSGIRRQLLMVRNGSISQVDTRFDDARGVYGDTIAAGLFPELEPPHPALAWLGRRVPTSDTTLLMSNTEPFRVSLLPLPISLSELFEELHGRPAAGFQDARHRRWSDGPWRTQPAQLAPFDAQQLAELESEFHDYRHQFRRALLSHGKLHRSDRLAREELSLRQAAIADLMPRLGGL